MSFNKKIIIFGILLIAAITVFAFSNTEKEENKNILSHTVNLGTQNLKFYWKNEKDENFKNFKNLKEWTSSKSEHLVFAMNGGMYKKDLSPQGLYIENGEIKSKIDTLQNGYGNFYLQPNGIFYITNQNQGVICKTTDFKTKNVKYATQSGPLLLIEGEIHSKFNEGSKNLNIRNGVGILPNGELLFAMSKQKINFYDFANYFKSLGCKNALYLDGFVSKTYLPEKDWVSTDGNFGVIIAETKKNTNLIKTKDTALDYKTEYIASNFEFPVGKPNAKGYYNAQKFGENNHLGDDWNSVKGGNSDLGDPIYAIANGYVKFAEDYGGGWGNVIRINHKLKNDKFIESLYAHCDSIIVKKGEWVKKGDKIGTIGNANGQYLAHLHLEIRDNVNLPIGGGYSENTSGYLDPTKFIKEN